MKILFIISSLSAGGAERVLTNLANHLCQKHEIIIATFSNEDSFYPLDNRIQHIKLNLLHDSKHLLMRFKNVFYRIKVLMHRMLEIKADINISFMIFTNLLAVLAAKLLNQKIIVSERTSYHFYTSTVLHLIRRGIYPLSDYLVTQTNEDKKNYAFIKNVKVINNPLIINNSFAKKEKIILGVGRLDDSKGFDKLLYAFSTLNCPDWELIIIGDGPEKKNLLALIKNLNVKNVTLLSKRTDIFDWYTKSSIFVLSSKKEGFPNVLLEAMGSGCAVVSFDCPHGPREIIDSGINGLLVENQNTEKLTKAMQILIDNENLRNTLAQESLKVRENYSIQKIAAQWEEIMDKVINS